MQCKSLWIKASAKCINVNVNVKQCIVVIYDSAERVPLWLSANQRAKAQFESGSYVTSLNILNPISGTVLSGAQK